MEHVIRILENELIRRNRQQESPNLHHESKFYVANKKRIEALEKAIKILSNERERLGKHEQKEKRCSMKDTGCPYIKIVDVSCNTCAFLK